MNSWEKNSISPEFHPATKPLTVEPVDSGNEIGVGEENTRVSGGHAQNVPQGVPSSYGSATQAHADCIALKRPKGREKRGR